MSVSLRRVVEIPELERWFPDRQVRVAVRILRTHVHERSPVSVRASRWGSTNLVARHIGGLVYST